MKEQHTIPPQGAVCSTTDLFNRRPLKYASQRLWCNVQECEERKSRSVVLQCFVKTTKKTNPKQVNWRGRKGKNSDIPYSYLHSFHQELSATVDSLWRIARLFTGACAVGFSLHNYTVTLQWVFFPLWLCECVGVVRVETHTHTDKRRWGVSLLYCTDTLHSLLQKLQIQFKGLFFINLYLSGLSWLSERAVFHYFPRAHIHSGEPRWKKKKKKTQTYLFQATAHLIPSLVFWGSLKHTRPVEGGFGDFSGWIAALALMWKYWKHPHFSFKPLMSLNQLLRQPEC